MQIVKTSKNGIEYLSVVLKEKPQTTTRAWFWKIVHKSGKEEIHLKIGRYKKGLFMSGVPATFTPKSALTLDDDEFKSLSDFICSNYEPFRTGVKQYISVDDSFSSESVENLKSIFGNPNKGQLLEFVIKNDILPQDIIRSLQYQERIKAIEQFQQMLVANLVEQEWQKWFKQNDWVLGTEFVKVLDERELDTSHITDYLMQAYDGFLDIVEIKRPEGELRFWSSETDHGNYIPSMDLNKAITQATKYIYELERESNSQKFYERVGSVKTIKPRCILIYGRSNDWDNNQREAYRILNSCYHNLTILTYDHVLNRAQRILGLTQDQSEESTTIGMPIIVKATEEINIEEIPW